ncbi:bacteriocin-like protein, partial [Chryseobacterium populi]
MKNLKKLSRNDMKAVTGAVAAPCDGWKLCHANDDGTYGWGMCPPETGGTSCHNYACGGG